MKRQQIFFWLVAVLAGGSMASGCGQHAGGALPAFDALWDYGDPAGTEARFREILPHAQGSDSAAYRAELLTQIARCQGLRDDFAGAHATLDEVERMLAPDMRRARVRYLLERGRAFNSGGKPDAALPLFEEAWRLAGEAGETRLALDALHMIAIAQPDAAGKVEWNLKGIAAANEVASQRGWLPAFYNNLGEAYAEQGDYGNALEAFRDLAAFESEGVKSPGVYTRKDVARMLRLLGRTDEAIATIQPVHAELERKGEPDGWVDEQFAECLLAAGRRAEATPLFRRAYQALKDDAWVKKHDLAKLQRLEKLIRD